MVGRLNPLHHRVSRRCGEVPRGPGGTRPMVARNGSARVKLAPCPAPAKAAEMSPPWPRAIQPEASARNDGLQVQDNESLGGEPMQGTADGAVLRPIAEGECRQVRQALPGSELPGGDAPTQVVPDLGMSCHGAGAPRRCYRRPILALLPLQSAQSVPGEPPRLVDG